MKKTNPNKDEIVLTLTRKQFDFLCFYIGIGIGNRDLVKNDKMRLLVEEFYQMIKEEKE